MTTAIYRHILVAVEHSAADRTILEHVVRLAEGTGARILLVHVADGWAARYFNELNLRESEEMHVDRAYLDALQEELSGRGFDVTTRLALGDPARELVKVAADEAVDLIAMSTHGHRFLADMIHGTTADRVRHEVSVPVLLLRAQSAPRPDPEP
jgi:nucleotide-binding universal stress UspA family protein